MREIQAGRRFIREALMAHATLLAAVTDGAITKIYPYSAPQTRGYPFITITFAGGAGSFVFGNSVPVYTRPSYQVKVVSDRSLEEANQLSSYIVDALAVAEGEIEEDDIRYWVNSPILDLPIEFSERGEGNKSYHHAGGVYRMFVQPIPEA